MGIVSNLNALFDIFLKPTDNDKKKVLGNLKTVLTNKTKFDARAMLAFLSLLFFRNNHVTKIKTN